MIILQIMLIPMLTLVLVSMVFVVGVTGLVDSDYPPDQELSGEIETGADFPIVEVGYNGSDFLPAADAPFFMFYQVDKQ